MYFLLSLLVLSQLRKLWLAVLCSLFLPDSVLIVGTDSSSFIHSLWVKFDQINQQPQYQLHSRQIFFLEWHIASELIYKLPGELIKIQISWPYPKIIWVGLRMNMHFISIPQKHKTASSQIFLFSFHFIF